MKIGGFRGALFISEGDCFLVRRSGLGGRGKFGRGHEIGEGLFGGEDRMRLIEEVFAAADAVSSPHAIGRSAMAAVRGHQKTALPAKRAMIPIPNLALWTFHTETLPQRYMTSNEECP